MKLIFAGTPEFAAAALKALIAAGHEITLVLTQPDRPAGRGMRLKASPVKEVALAQGLSVAQPEILKNEEAWQPIRDAAADVMVVAAYGLILPVAVLAMPRLGCVNIHASLLPRWRGAAPIHRAIEAGDRETGITLMQMDRGLDTGDMLVRAALPILDTDTSASLHDKLAALGAREIVALLPRLEHCLGEKQDDGRASYARKVVKDDARLDWTRPAGELDRQIRAFAPTHALYAGDLIKIWQARPTAKNGGPGTVLEVSRDGLLVACGSGALNIMEMQKPGGKRLPVSAFLAGTPLKTGDILE